MKRLIGFIVIILFLFSSFTFALPDKTVEDTPSISRKNEGNFITVNENEFKSIIAGEEYKIVAYTNILKKKGSQENQIGQSIYIVQAGDSLYLIAVRNNTTIQEIKDLNNLDSDMLMVGQHLLLPGQTDESDNELPDNGDSPDPEDPGPNNNLYTVKPGDSLYLIAIRNKTTIQEIKDLNNLNSDMLMVGQELLLPGQADEGPDNNPDPENPGSNNNIYTVKSGDSLYLIALRNETTIQEIKELNNLNSDMLIIGQELLIPGQADQEDTPGDGNENSDNNQETPEEPETGESNLPIVYFVKPGDSLWLISNKFNTTSENIININHLPGNSLYVGQLLYITTPDTESKKVLYNVQKGDNLSLIADQFTTNINQIMETNNLSSEQLFVGQKLIINIPDYTNRNYNIILDYQVEAGDNVKTISSKFDISSWELRDFNDIRYDFLSPGYQVQLPFLITDSINQSMDITPEEMELLSRAVYSEARGEPFEGQVAVAAVILNRVRNSVFPETIEGVIFQPWQFTAINDGQFWLEPGQTAYLAAQAALEGWDPSGGALYYYNPETATSDWIFYRDVIIKIGEHYFAVSV